MTIDIAIIGAGFSGLSLAHTLSTSNLKVVAIERKLIYPDAFRAEKIELDQAKIMGSLGILQYRSPCDAPIGIIDSIENNNFSKIDTIEQYGISYSETVNNLRAELPDSIKILNKSIINITDSDNKKTLHFNDNSTLEAKIVVLCTGGNNKLTNLLGIQRVIDEKLKSLSFGFDISRVDESDFNFNGLNYHVNDVASKINYITIFPIGDRMRVNLFTQLDTKDKLAYKLKNNTIETLESCFPNIFKHTGEIEITSKIQIMPTQFYRVKNHIKKGLVVLADEYQSVNPVTGKGLSKVLTDVKLLGQKYLPQWIEKNDCSIQKIRQFYNDPEKVSCDKDSLYSWIHYYQNISLNKLSLIHKLKLKCLIYC